jgi:serine protease inhibitor
MQQQTAFMLDEYGAKIEGQATAAAAAAHETREDKPIPKEMLFNKPFLVILKRKDSPNPYFAMWVENTELMQK